MLDVSVAVNFSIVVNKQLFQMTTDHFTAAVTIKRLKKHTHSSLVDYITQN